MKSLIAPDQAVIDALAEQLKKAKGGLNSSAFNAF